MRLERREFNRAILAATAGLLAGAAIGCSKEEPKKDEKPAEGSSCSGKDGCSAAGEKKEGATCKAGEEKK